MVKIYKNLVYVFLFSILFVNNALVVPTDFSIAALTWNVGNKTVKDKIVEGETSGSKITICIDSKVSGTQFINQTLVHELSHRVTSCMGVATGNPCDQTACSELRASIIDGTCPSGPNQLSCLVTHAGYAASVNTANGGRACASQSAANQAVINNYATCSKNLPCTN